MFKVNTEELKRCSTQFNNDADALKNKAREIDIVCDALNGLSGMELVIETLRLLNETLRKEAGLQIIFQRHSEE